MLPKAAGAAAQTWCSWFRCIWFRYEHLINNLNTLNQCHVGTGDRGMDNFLMSQQLQNQKFMHDMMLVQARAESRIPGAQYGGSLLDQARAEREITDAGEITNREVQGIGRMIYGTGLRA